MEFFEFSPEVERAAENAMKKCAERFAELDELCDETPLGRLGKASEVAKAVRAIAENSFITGQILGVDGGFY